MSVQKKEKATWEMLDRFFLRVLGEKEGTAVMAESREQAASFLAGSQETSPSRRALMQSTILPRGAVYTVLKRRGAGALPPPGCRCHRAKAFCYQGKRYHFCRVAAADRCGAWTAAGAPERSAKGRQGQDKRYLYRRTDRDTGHSGSGTAAAGAESIHGGTRAQSCPMAGRAKASRIAPPNQDGTSLTFRQGR